MQKKDTGWAKRLLLIILIPLYLITVILFLIRYIVSIFAMPSEAWRLAVSFDRLANTVFGGSMNETISKRAGRCKDQNLTACVLCKFLDVFDKDHCAKELSKNEPEQS